MNRSAMIALALCLGACKGSPPADPAFSDALHFLFTGFEAHETDLAFAMRDLEAQVYATMEVGAGNVNDRAVQPEPLAAADVVGLNDEGRDPGACIPVAVAFGSAFELDQHPRVQMLTDQRPVEPYSPDKFDRTFLAGEDCWEGGDCPRLETSNDLIKKNTLMEVPYLFLKDFRWVDLNLPAPSELDADEPRPTETADPRWAIVARSWTTKSFAGDSEKAFIHQTYTIEVWNPRDGGGFLDASRDADSSGGGTLRMLALWSETEFKGLNVGDDAVVATTRGGIDRNFNATEDWLAEN